jgi:ArsR family transcriptional regulator
MKMATTPAPILGDGQARGPHPTSGLVAWSPSLAPLSLAHNWCLTRACRLLRRSRSGGIPAGLRHARSGDGSAPLNSGRLALAHAFRDARPSNQCILHLWSLQGTLLRTESTRPSQAMTPASDVAPPGADFLRLLADPTRRQIFMLLMKGETCNCEVAGALELPENLVSHHLRRLREAGLVEEHPDPVDARWVHFTVSRSGLTTAWRVLSGAFGPDRLGAREPACEVRARREGRVASVKP